MRERKKELLLGNKKLLETRTAWHVGLRWAEVFFLCVCVFSFQAQYDQYDGGAISAERDWDEK